MRKKKDDDITIDLSNKKALIIMILLIIVIALQFVNKFPDIDIPRPFWSKPIIVQPECEVTCNCEYPEVVEKECPEWNFTFYDWDD